MYANWGWHFGLPLSCFVLGLVVFTVFPASLPLEGEPQSQQLRCGALFKPPSVWAEYKGLFVWNSEEREEKKHTQWRRWGAGGGKSKQLIFPWNNIDFF